MQERYGALLFHGFSGNGASILNLASEVFDSKWTVEAPDAPFALSAPSSRAWWRRVGKPAETLDDGQLIEVEFSLQMLMNQIDQSQHLVVGGFSQGAAIALGLVTRASGNRAINLLFMAGRSPWSRETLMESLVDATPARALICHGRQDQRIPFTEAEMVSDVLNQSGWDVSSSITDYGHRVTRLQRQSIKQWIAEIT